MLCYHTSEMSCPYFDPVAPNPRGGGAQLAYWPLGDAWTGTCHAAAVEEQPRDSLCNLGYARGICPRFPAGDPGPDAARFTIIADHGASLRLYYVLERDHLPFAHGAIEYAPGGETFLPAPAGDLTARQAGAYVTSYLRRKAATGGQ